MSGLFSAIFALFETFFGSLFSLLTNFLPLG